MKVDELSIDPRLREYLLGLGIEELYPPQAEAVSKGLLEGTNQVVAVPTASGKTLIAIFAIVSSLLNNPGSKAVYLAPLRALASEKYIEFREIAELFGFRVKISTGDLDEKSNWLGSADIIIATNEKFDSLIRHELPWLNQISVIVSDEVHLINDKNRGPVLEVVLSLVKRNLPECQMIALSATITNADEIADWMDAELVMSSWRPIKLVEGVWNRGSVRFSDGAIKSIGSARDKDGYVSLSLDMVESGGQVLVFANTRKSAVASAKSVANALDRKLSSEERADLYQLAKNIRSIGENTDLRKDLAHCVERGVAFHHAGLSGPHRKLVEDGFKQHLIKVVTATPTLCLAPKTQIWHEMDETTVDEYDVDQPLFALHGSNLKRIKPVEIVENHNLQELIRIVATTGFSIDVTPNHRMLVKRDGEKLVIPASEINPTDKIATIGKLHHSNTDTLTIQDFVVDNSLPIENHPIEVNFSYFIGCMLGDGHSGAEVTPNGIKYKGNASITGNDVEIINHATKIAKHLGISHRKTRSYYDVPELILPKSKWFREMLVRMGIDIGHSKHINKRLMKMSDDNIAGILRGLFDSDGYVISSKHIGFSNSSLQLIKDTQKLLLRFGIITRFRKQKPGVMQMGSKPYKTKWSYSLSVAQKESIIVFYKNIGFNIQRKQAALEAIVEKLQSNILYYGCNQCDYKIYYDLFSGRTKNQQLWGKIKKEVIEVLGSYGELGSNALKNQIGVDPKKNESRLNHHYELIQKRKIGSISQTEWFWSLNEIGQWVFSNLLDSNISFRNFFENENCPLCFSKFEKVIKKGWRSDDFEGDIFWDNIRKISTIDVENSVYDVVLSDETPNDHMFVANGFIVHNSIGINMPGRRVIIRSLSRYEVGFGNTLIPVLEYKQMAGRAGRPRYDPFGEAIIIAKNEKEQNKLLEKYLHSDTEEIYSKLGVETALRSHILAFIASGYVESFDSAMEMIGHTFYGYQNEGAEYLVEDELYKVLDVLKDSKMISAEEPFQITPFGKRVSELYLDPLSARLLKNGLELCLDKDNLPDIAYLQLISTTPDVRSYSVRKTELPELLELANRYENDWIDLDIYNATEFELDLFLSSLKTADTVEMWLEEASEQQLAEKYNISSGDLHSIINRMEWLVHAAAEISKIFKWKAHSKALKSVNDRLKYGVRKELLPLVELPGIGRVRARLLFRHGFKTVEDVSKASYAELSSVPGFGTGIIQQLKKYFGGDAEEIPQESPPQDELNEDLNEDLPEPSPASLDDFF